MELLEAVRKRRMVRNYTGRPVDKEVLERIVEVGRSAPSAGFAQGQRFVIVTSDERRREIARLALEDEYAAKGFDRWLSSAPAHVVLCIDQAAYSERYAAPDKASRAGGVERWPVPYEAMDTGASMMLLLLAAVDEGLAAGFFGAHRLPGLNDLLEIPPHVTAVGIVTIGYPAPDRRSTSLRSGWRALDEVVHWEQWTEPR